MIKMVLKGYIVKPQERNSNPEDDNLEFFSSLPLCDTNLGVREFYVGHAGDLVFGIKHPIARVLDEDAPVSCKITFEVDESKQ